MSVRSFGLKKINPNPDFYIILHLLTLMYTVPQALKWLSVPQKILKMLVLIFLEIVLATKRHMGYGYVWLVFGCAETGCLGGVTRQTDGRTALS